MSKVQLASPRTYNNPDDGESHIIQAGYYFFLIIPCTARVILDGTCQYLASCKTLRPLGFAVHRVLQVLMCIPCKACILPKDGPGHCHSEHGLKVENRDEFMEACTRWGVHQTYIDVLHPSPRGPPVELIPMEKGYACSVDPRSCAFACCSREWMEKHVGLQHPDHDSFISNCYRSQITLQTLFSPIGKKYVEVEPALRNVSNEDVFARIVQEYIPALPASSIPGPDNPNERDALLRLMQWDTFMEPYYTVPSKRAAIIHLRSPPSQADSPLQQLRTAMQDYVRLGIKVGRDVSPNLTVRKHLVQGRHLSSVPL